MDIAEEQKQAYLEGRRRYQAKTGIHPDAPVLTADTSDARRLDATWRELTQGKVSKEPSAPVATVAERKPGDRLREATEFADALGKLRRGHAGQALDHVCRVEVIKDGHFRVTLPGGE